MRDHRRGNHDQTGRAPPWPWHHRAAAVLFKLVSTAQSARLIAITAPAGSARPASLAAACLLSFTPQATVPPWLTIDPEDDEPARFLHCVTRALYGAVDGIDPSAVGLDTQTSLVAPHAIVSAMINQLTEIDDEIFLMLDDFTGLRSPRNPRGGVIAGGTCTVELSSRADRATATATAVGPPEGEWRAARDRRGGAALRRG